MGYGVEQLQYVELIWNQIIVSFPPLEHLQ